MKAYVIAIFVLTVFISGCYNEFRFRTFDVNNSPIATPPENETARNPDSENPKPSDPIIDPKDPTDINSIVYKSGDCGPNLLNVSACLSCQVSMKPIAVPLSTKGAQLLQIMEAGCQILNKSDPNGYSPPSRREILNFLNRANVKNYPDSSPTQRQKTNLTKWLDGDKDHLKKLFGGLWYQPPFSTDFETYFGLEPKEARYFFCYQSKESSFSEKNEYPLFSVDYYSCVQDPNSFCRESQDYITANGYRSQLKNSILESLNDPFNSDEMVPANKCIWETMSGNFNLEMENKLIDWKNKGYEIAVYFESAGPRCESLTTANIPVNAKVTVAGKLCTEF